MRLSAGPASAAGSSAGMNVSGAAGDQRLSCGKMSPRMSAQFGKRGMQFGRCLASENGFRLYAMALQQIERHEKLPPRGMQRERSQ